MTMSLNRIANIEGGFNKGKVYRCTYYNPCIDDYLYLMGTEYPTNGSGIVDGWDDGSLSSFCSKGGDTLLFTDATPYEIGDTVKLSEDSSVEGEVILIQRGQVVLKQRCGNLILTSRPYISPIVKEKTSEEKVVDKILPFWTDMFGVDRTPYILSTYREFKRIEKEIEDE